MTRRRRFERDCVYFFLLSSRAAPAFSRSVRLRDAAFMRRRRFCRPLSDRLVSPKGEHFAADVGGVTAGFTGRQNRAAPLEVVSVL